jgi:hypothetical protein
MKLELNYDVNGSARRFWELFFDPEFTRRMHLEALGSTSVEIESFTGDIDSGIERTVRYAQVPDARGPVKKLFGAEVVTTEHGAFDPESWVLTFSLTPGTLGDKTDIRGTIELFAVEGAVDGDRCEQAFSLEAKVKIFGAGPVVERFIEKQARDAQDRAAAFINKELDG